MFDGWYQGEPGWQRVRRELQRLARRARRRWVRTLLVTLTASALVVIYRARKQSFYTAYVVFKMEEHRQSAGEEAPPTKAQLQDYIYDGVFTKTRLARLLKKHGLYPSYWVLDPQWALEKFRDDIDIQVWRNYFLSDNTEIERSARIKISYTYTDPDLALTVGRELGDLIRAAEAEMRRSVAAVVARTLATATDVAMDELQRLRRRQAELTRAIETGGRRGRQVIELEKVRRASQELRFRLEAIRGTAVQSALRDRLERRSLGMQLRQVDYGRPHPLRISKSVELVILAVLVFVLVLPMAAIGVGAGDTKVYDLDDIQRLGVKPLGHVPRYKGWTSGAMQDRREVPPR